MKIFIIEDEPVILEKLSLIFSTEKGFDVVGAFSSAEEAISNINKAMPDMVLVDIKLPGMSGIEFIEIIKERTPTINLIAFSGYEDRETVISAFRAGASGFILKGSSSRELLKAIDYVQTGGIAMSPPISRIVINELCNHNASNHFLLTEREQHILKGIEEDLSYQEIAENCDISRNTVHAHAKKIYQKLKAKGRKDAIQKARRNGLL